MKLCHLGTVKGINRWVSWCRRRRALVLWLRTEGKPAFSVEIPVGRLLHELGVSITDIEEAVAVYRLTQAGTAAKEHRSRSGRRCAKHCRCFLRMQRAMEEAGKEGA